MCPCRFANLEEIAVLNLKNNEITPLMTFSTGAVALLGNEKQFLQSAGRPSQEKRRATNQFSPKFVTFRFFRIRRRPDKVALGVTCSGLAKKAEIWTHWDLNPGPSACEADVIPLHHVPL